MIQSGILRILLDMVDLWQGRVRNGRPSKLGRMTPGYARAWSMWLYFVLPARTAKTVVFGQGAYRAMRGRHGTRRIAGWFPRYSYRTRRVPMEPRGVEA